MAEGGGGGGVRREQLVLIASDFSESINISWPTPRGGGVLIYPFVLVEVDFYRVVFEFFM